MGVIDFIKKISKEAYTIPIVLSLFLIPLFWNPSFIYSFTQGKEVLFKTIILAALLFLLPIFAHRKNYVLKNIAKSPIFFLLLLQICVYAITNIFSDTPIVSLYGGYSRGFGFIIELFLFAFLIYCSLTLSGKNILGLLKVVFVSGLAVAVYAIFQKIGLDPFFNNFDTNIFAGRVFSFSGNPSYLGQLMLINTLNGGFLVFSGKNRRESVFYMLGTLILLAALFFSETRTALIGLAVALTFLFIKYFKSIINTLRRCKILIVVIILLAGIVFAILPQERYSFSNIALRSLNSRFEIWNGTLNLIKEKPLLGYGGDTFYIYFPEIITKKFLALEENININADRVHNETLEIFFSHGTFAVLIYLMLLGLIVKIFFKSKNRLVLILALLIISNAAQNQFAFPDISTSVLMAFCFGGLIALEVGDGDIGNISIKKWQHRLLGPIILLFVVYLAFVTVYKPYMSQLAYAESRENYSMNYSIAVNKHKEALAHTPYYSELWYELMFIDPSSMERALFYLKQIDGNTGNLLAWQGNYYANIDPQKASKFYIDVLEKNPYHPNWIRAFADMLYRQGDYENALYMYTKYLESIPDFWKWTEFGENDDPARQRKYETFIKHTPYFWETMKKIDYIVSVLEEK